MNILSCIDWFYQNLIFDRDKILNREVMNIENNGFARQIKDLSYSGDIERHLLEVARLFHNFCKYVYGRNIFEELPKKEKETILKISAFLFISFFKLILNFSATEMIHLINFLIDEVVNTTIII